MVRLIKLIFCSAVILALCQACDSPPPPPDQTQKSLRPVPQKPDKQAAEAQNYVWPRAKSNEEVIISQNLLVENYYVVFDCSGSMADSRCSGNLTKLDAAKVALAKFAQLVPSDANLGLMVFQRGEIMELVPLGTDNRKQFIEAANQTGPEGGTPLFSAVRDGYIHLEEQGRRQLGYGEYTLVIVTDGEASGGQDPTRIVHWVLNNSPVQIHTIGFCIGTDHSLNIPGRTVYKPADNPDQLQKGLRDVLAEAEHFDVSDFK